jgi:GDPmannose 4,6-dehydratase
MLQQETPDDYVLATNETHSVREFIEKAFGHIGITIKWMGPHGTVDEVGVNAANEEEVLVKIDARYFRPTEVDILIGNPAKAEKQLGWKPTTLFHDLVAEMVKADIEMVDNGQEND